MKKVELQIRTVDEKGKLSREVIYYLSSLEAVDDVIGLIDGVMSEEEDTPDGRIISPLPPDRIKKRVEGVVNPKPPGQVNAERKRQLQEVPDGN